MAKKRRQSQRIEPTLKARATPDRGKLDIGLKDSDRPAGRGGASPRRKPAKKPAAGRAKTTSRKRRKARGAGGSGSGFGRFVRRAAYWAAVLAVWSTVALAAVLGYFFAKLPPTADWTVPKHAASVQILASNGGLITNRSDTGGASLSLDDMPPYLPEAVISIEDRRFYHHFGVDPIGLARAMVTNIRAGGIVQGGSTITQQLAKNLFLTPDRTIERKIQEVILALWLEARLSKKQILELYLNRVYLGAGAYGVDAAAHRYFGKSARNLTLAEAATIAGLLKAPSHYSPILHPKASEARTQTVLSAMHEAGYISDREASLALSQPIKPVHDMAGGSGRYIADWIMDLLPGYVGSVDQDIVVETTIDMRLQTAAAKAISDTLRADAGKHGASQGAFVALDTDGAVKALVGGRDYATGPYDRAIDARRQPGSAFKPFVYLTALESGLMPETVRIDQPVSIKGWKPQNYSKHYRGPVTLQTALALSINTISAQLVAEVGPKAVVATARRLGITSPLTATPSIALGTSEVGLLEMTGAFVPFSNGGTGIIPHVINRIVTRSGKVLYRRTGSGPGQVIAPRYVAMMNSMLEDTVREGTGKRAAIPGWQVAGKTGTSQDYRDAWFIGYTGVLTAGAWFGNDDGSPTKKASGSNLPAEAWHAFMSQALDGVAVANLPGNYRFRDPANFASGAATPETIMRPMARAGDRNGALGPGASPGAVAAAGILSDNNWPEDSGPVPPADIGGPAPPPRPRRSGFFQRLFGG